MIFLDKIYDFTKMTTHVSVGFILFELIRYGTFVTKENYFRLGLNFSQVTNYQRFFVIVWYDKWTYILFIFNVIIQVLIAVEFYVIFL